MLITSRGFQLQTLISCRGLRTLVDMMDESCELLFRSRSRDPSSRLGLPTDCFALGDGTDNENKDLVWMAVDGISRVFESNVRLLGRSLASRLVIQTGEADRLVRYENTGTDTPQRFLPYPCSRNSPGTPD